MKLNRLITLCAMVATLALSATGLLAQDNNNNNNNNGGGGGGGRRNFDPAQFQQRMMDNIRDQLDFTNDTDWSAVQPLIQKVMDARRDMGGMGGMMRMFRNRNNNDGGNNQRRNNFFGQPSPEADALQKALDDNAPAGQIKDLLAKYEAAQKNKQAKLESAQSDLRQVLTVKQEAQATLLGLLN